jgi:hypothetical protein
LNSQVNLKIKPRELSWVYTVVGLQDKILEFHPEIAKSGLQLTVTFDAETQRYVLQLRQAGQEFSTFRDKKDADACRMGRDVLIWQCN